YNGRLTIFSQNVQKKYKLVEELLQRNDIDVLMVQEPPWRLIRRTVSTTDKDSDLVYGPPINPNWTPVFPGAYSNDEPPRVVTYVHNCLKGMRPKHCTDIVRNRDVIGVSLHNRGDQPLLLINMYSDATGAAINWLYSEVGSIPDAFLLAG